MEGHCSTDQSPQWAVVPMEEGEEEEEEETRHCVPKYMKLCSPYSFSNFMFFFTCILE